MKCREFKEKLTLLTGAELDAPEREACERHAGECRACARLLEDTRRTLAAVRQAVAGDARRAEAALEGFEERVLERRRRERMAAALGDAGTRRRGRTGAARWALGLSLVVNVCVLAALGLGYWGPRGLGYGEAGLGGWTGSARARTGRGATAEAVRVLPAGLPQEAQMRQVYGELEALFGDRLNWVAQSGGEVSMGVISDPAKARTEGTGQGPLVALVYWMDTEGNGGAGGNGASRAVVILTRSGGGEIRQQAPLGPGRAPVEIAVDSFRTRRGGFTIQTRVLPVARREARGGARDSVSALTADVSLSPGQPTKLGEVRVGERMVDAYVAVQVLGTGEPRDAEGVAEPEKRAS